MTTLEKYDRLGIDDLLRSTWPFSAIALDLPVRDVLSMRVEEYTDGDTLVVKAELPGVDPDEDVEITVEGGLLTIEAERREEKTEGEQGKPGYRSEFRYGSMRRVLRLPDGAQEDAVTATYADGILEVRVPVGAAEAAPTRIPVARG
ncbi:MAG: Hsp20 family protein [Frankiales bacterium]|nr:Hsp20 family protein [Frankiales bacterium]